MLIPKNLQDSLRFYFMKLSCDTALGKEKCKFLYLSELAAFLGCHGNHLHIKIACSWVSSRPIKERPLGLFSTVDLCVSMVVMFVSIS